MRKKGLIASLAATLVAASMLGAHAAPEVRGGSPGNGRIMFTASFNADRRIYTMSDDGSDVAPASAGPADFNPEYSPDGTRIAWDDGVGIWIADAAGANARMLGSGIQPTFSPKGEIVFVRNGDLYRMKATGGKLTRILKTKPREASPEVSPTGDKIAFQRHMKGGGSLWVMRSDGTNVRRIGPDDGPVSLGSFRPDGEWIAFSWGNWASDPDFELYRAKIDGSKIRRLTDNDVDDWAPRYSPDGTMLVWDQGNDSMAIVKAPVSDLTATTTLQDTTSYRHVEDWQPVP